MTTHGTERSAVALRAELEALRARRDAELEELRYRAAAAGERDASPRSARTWAGYLAVATVACVLLGVGAWLALGAARPPAPPRAAATPPPTTPPAATTPAEPDPEVVSSSASAEAPEAPSAAAAPTPTSAPARHAARRHRRRHGRGRGRHVPARDVAHHPAPDDDLGLAGL